MDQYVALSKKDLELSISLNEVYAIHALLEKHSKDLASALNRNAAKALVTNYPRTQGTQDISHLNILLSELGPATPQLPRSENRTAVLPLFSRWEASMVDDISAALDITPVDVYFMEAKSAFVQLVRCLPTNSSAVRRPLKLEKIADTAATVKDVAMVRKGIRALELLAQLEEMGVVTKSDGYSILREEVEQELNHLGSLKEKILDETRKLEEVYKTIQDNNRYLVGQLETYKSYLHNVRSQSEGKQRKQQKHQVLGPYKFTHAQLEKEGVIQKSNVPDNR